MSQHPHTQPLPQDGIGRYRHYKGGEYLVLSIARHSETMEPLVCYRQLDKDTGFWVRPHDMFFGELEVDGKLQRRFVRIGD
jgi:hypothetical protein